MQLGCNNGSFALPPKREGCGVQVVEASAAPAPTHHTDGIVITKAQDRFLELIEREQLPADVRYTLAGALSGDLRRQQLLFQAMVDTWPRLQKALAEVKRAVRKALWQVKPWQKRGQKPKTGDETLASEIESYIWSMKPDVARGEKGFEGMVEELATGYFFGHQVIEVRWARDARGYRPRSAKVVPPRFYGYPFQGHEEDRLMFDPTGGMGAINYVDFPEHKFLLAINGGHPGHPTVAAPLRVLATYWLAAVYGLKWLTQFAQICGVPFRWATYATGDDKSKIAVSNMLSDMGSSAWGAFPSGTEVHFEETGKGANTVAQKVLLDLADEQCDIFILGQTLTSSAGDKGSQALGKVHEGVRQDVIEGVCDFVGEILTYQLVPAIYALNYGESRDELPGVWAEWKEERDLKGEAERFNMLKGLNIPIRKEEGYEALGLQIPAEGDELLFEPSAATPDQKPTPGEPMAKDGGKKPVEAADAGDEPMTVDKLSVAVLEGLTGVSREWLSPVRPFFDRLAALAMSKHVTDEDFLAALEKAQAQIPELFDLLDAQALEDAFSNAIGSAALAGSVKRYE